MSSVRTRHPAPHTMFRIYFSSDNFQQVLYRDTYSLAAALNGAEELRNKGYVMVTIQAYPSDSLVGKPGTAGAGAEYVPQMLN